MVILKSLLFNQFPEIIFGFSSKIGSDEPPYYNNLSLSVGDDPEKVKARRNNFFITLGIEHTVFQKQIHSNIIKYVDHEEYAGESDALITDRPGLGLLISAADCTSVYIYDYHKKVIAGIHAGWRGTRQDIVEKTITELIDNYKCSPGSMAAYIAPSICRDVYEVDADAALNFDEKYYITKGQKYLLDVPGKNYDALRYTGIPAENIQYSGLCTYQLKNLLHSYRRDGTVSGRSLGVIAMREKK